MQKIIQCHSSINGACPRICPRILVAIIVLGSADRKADVEKLLAWFKAAAIIER